MSTPRGRGRNISTVLADALAGRDEARAPALAAAFADACGWPLARELAVKGLTRDGRLLVVASTQGWADQLAALGGVIRARINARFGSPTVHGLEIRVGPLAR